MNPDGKEINLEDSVMQLQKRILTLERNISLFIENDNRIENGISFVSHSQICEVNEMFNS